MRGSLVAASLLIAATSEALPGPPALRTDAYVFIESPASGMAGTQVHVSLVMGNSPRATLGELVFASYTAPSSEAATLEIVSFTADPDMVCAENSQNRLQCTASLSPGTSRTAEIGLQIPADASGRLPLAHTASAFGGAFEFDSSNNSATVPFTVTQSADLRVTKTAAAAALPGSQLDYHLALTNDGPSFATTATLTDVLPAGMTFVSLSQTGGSTFTCTTPTAGANGTVTCTRSGFAPGAPAGFDLRVSVQATPGATIANTARVTAEGDPSGDIDPDSTNDTASAQTSVLAAGAAIPALAMDAPAARGDPRRCGGGRIEALNIR